MKTVIDSPDNLATRDHVAELFRINMIKHGYADTNEALSDAFYETFGRHADGDNEEDCKTWNDAFSTVMSAIKKEKD